MHEKTKLDLSFVFQIQANVKVLTAERDKLNNMYDEVSTALHHTSLMILRSLLLLCT